MESLKLGRFLKSIGIVLLCAVTSAAVSCEPPQILAPRPHETVDASKSTVVWSRAPIAKEFDLTITIRVPEGEAISRATIRTVNAHQQIVIPENRPLMGVTVSLRAHCVDGHQSVVVDRSFFIDTRNSCTVPLDASIVQRHRSLTIAWPNINRIASAQARVFADAQAVPGELVVSTNGTLQVEAPEGTRSVVGWRVICSEPAGVSEWAWIRIGDSSHQKH